MRKNHDRKPNDMQTETEGLAAFFATLSTPVKAATLALVVTVLRFAYDNDRRKWTRKTLEAALCTTVAWGISSGLHAIGLHSDAAYLVAVALGWLGADFVRERARAWVSDKSGESDS